MTKPTVNFSDLKTWLIHCNKCDATWTRTIKKLQCEKCPWCMSNESLSFREHNKDGTITLSAKDKVLFEV